MEKEIKDKDAMMKILNLLFGKIPVFLNSEGQEIPLKVLSLKPNGIIVNMPKTIEGEERIITLTHNGNKFQGTFKKVGSDGKGIEMLSPVKIIIGVATRESQRLQAQSKELFVTNVINQNDVYKFMGYETGRVDAMVKNSINTLKKSFQNPKVYLSPRQDGRMRLINSFEKPIFVPNLKDTDSKIGDEFLPLAEFKKFLEANGMLERNTAEICIPMTYKGYTPLGYMQVLSDTPLDLNAYQQTLSCANALSKDLANSGIFQESKEICQVIDLSAAGLSFLHPPSPLYNRSFAIGEYILFDINLVDVGLVTIRAIIKSIKNQEKVFRIGCQLYNLNTNDQELYDRYIENMNKAGQSAPPPVAETIEVPIDGGGNS